MITDISGRGLGLAIVQEKVQRLGGTITVEAEINAGTRFRITLPLTLASFHGILVRAHESIFAVPISSVERVVRVNKADIQTVEN
ncbi:MAG: hybrid sensor histidine kinase/response regulator, partial [Candidatus Latescibacteria bacterium]|nr:hybrid sensor histidine kinase/response regulator [Candidatus Latescibacterota bacterium]